MKKKIFTVGATIIITALAALCIFLLLPYIINAFLQKVTKDLPLSHKEITILQITPWKTVGQLRIVQGANELSVARFEINYQPLSIIKKRIDTIFLQGVQLSLTEPLEKHETTDATPTQPFDFAAVAAQLPFTTDAITIDNASCTIQLQDQRELNVTINSQAQLTTTTTRENNYRLENIAAQIHIQGDIKAQIATQFSREDKHYSLEISGTSNIEELARIAHLQGGLGTLQSDASLTITEDLTKIQQIQVRLISDDLDLHHDNINLSTNTNLPLTVDLIGTPEDLSFTVNNLHFPTPYQLSGDINGRYQAANSSIDAQATITSPLSKPELHLSLKTNGETFALETQSNKRSLHIADQTVSVSAFTAHAKGKYSGGELDCDTSIFIDQIEISQPAITIKNIVYNQHLHLLGNKILKSTGNFTIENILYSKSRVGQLSGTTDIRRQGATVSIKGTTPLHKTLQVNCSGNVLFPSIDGTLECILPPTLITEANLPSTTMVAKSTKDLHFSGLLQSTLQLKKHETIEGTLSTRLSETTLRRGDNLMLTGINTSLTFPFLPRLQSSASQLLSIDQIKMGTTKATDAQLYFRLENLGNIFIEKSRFSWCGGTVESGSMNINTAKAAYNVTLYCDRIGFTELLDQLGVLHAEGTGTLNGRLPISFYDSTLHFDDGFLFSSPGDSGIVKFSNTDKVRQNIGSSIEMTYLDYSINALENFAYNWATLSFNSVKNDLVISMSLDGKPASPLPYAYSNGTLIPSSTGYGIQHPIRLDVNFHLPAAEIFRYGKNIQSFMEKM